MASLINEQLKQAVQAAIAGDWDASHQIAQADNSPTACWIHAVLHKLEGDAANSRYWYARSGGQCYEDYVDVQDELKAIAASLG